MNITINKFKKHVLEIGVISLAGILLLVSVVPGYVLADSDGVSLREKKAIDLQIEAMQNINIDYGALPEARLAEATPYRVMPVTAYNSVVWQTDDTPCIGAEGTDICKIYELGENICAANFVPLGTKIEVEGFGTCTVRDRMNSRYTYRVDWYMAYDVDAARKLGITNRQISLYPN